MEGPLIDDAGRTLRWFVTDVWGRGCGARGPTKTPASPGSNAQQQNACEGPRPDQADDLDFLCAVLGCRVAELLIPETRLMQRR
jgi:hypothetical protein